METTGEKCVRLLREIKSVAMATVDSEGRPKVRIIDVMLAENGVIYFCTARGKEFYSELIQQKALAVTGLTKDWEMVRINGEAIHLDEQKKWIDRIFEENPVMNTVYPGESRYILDPFCIKEGTAEYFHLGRHPIYREYGYLGNAEEKAENKKGVTITENCISCGTCLKACPQQCIIAGSPYRIAQENCLHCGRCEEVCPATAVQKR